MTSAIPTLPDLSLVTAPPAKLDVLVVGLAEGADGPQLLGVPAELVRTTSRKLGTALVDLATTLGAATSVGATAVLPATALADRLVVVGLGPLEAITPEVLRRAAGSALRLLAKSPSGTNPASVAVSLGAIEPETIRASAEGALLGSYRHQPLTAKDPAADVISSIAVVAEVERAELKALAGLPAEAGAVARAVVAARHWVNLPPNLLYPQTFAEQASSWVKGTKVSVEVLAEAELEKGGYGGLLAVGGGSSRGPRLVRLSYRPRGAKAHLALIGKGITFDSGGLNIKPGDSMYTMKCDMAGAAAVLAATRAIADLGLPVQVTAYGAMAENLPSGTAYRPSDVLTIHGGITVENANSDAEGRLVMADALARAQADSADLVIDVATLTGACMVALGDQIAGVFANSEAATERVLDAAEVSGEQFWALPLTDQFREGLTSTVADVKSSGGRMGGASSAAAFLERFVAEGTDWAHLDIAGPAFNTGKPHGHTPEGGTGVAVRTLIEVARSLAS